MEEIDQSLPSAEAVAEVSVETEEKRKPKKPKKPKGKAELWLEEKRGGVFPLLLSFLLPFCIFSLCLIFQGIYPFGDGQIINYDGWHQYYPFVMKLWDHFHEGTSLLYDWSMGMGTNFLSMLSYYGSSPLNLLLLFVPMRDFRLLFMFLVVLRVGLAGLFAGIFLKKTVKNPGWSIAFFASAYALCGYILGYYWNNMWLDTVALFPLLCLSVLSLFREGKCRYYVLLMALNLFSNYYIGYMSCVFVALSFFALCVMDRVRLSDFFRRGLRLLTCTLLGAGISAVLLLPALFGLLSTASTKDAVPMYVSFYESVRDLITPLSSFHVPAVMEGLPNLSTAALTALFAFSFLWAKKVGFEKKIVSFLFLIFLVFSMNFSVLNYIWHGFHYTNMIPYRFAYIFAFLVVIMAYYYYKKAVDAFDVIDGVGMLLFGVLVAFCATGYYPAWSILATVAVFALVAVACALYSAKLIPRKWFSLVLCGILLVELSVNAWLGTEAVDTSSYSEYYDSEIETEMEELVSLVKKKEGESPDFYRMELTQWRSLNDSCFYHYNGISQFSSSANRNVSAFLLGLGHPADPGSNRFVYVHSTPLSNTLLGVKYLINQDGYLSDYGLRCLSAASNEQTCALYEDTAFAGLGFLIDEGAAKFTFDMTKKPYERQNELFRLMTGLEGDLFSPIYATVEDHTNLSVTDLGDGRYEFTSLPIPEGTDPAWVMRQRYSIPETGMVYLYADVPMANYLMVDQTWHCIEDYPNFFSAGYFRKGESFQLRTIVDGAGYGEFTDQARFDAVMMDQALWEEGLAILKEGKMRITSFEDTGLEASVTAKKDGYLYTSIPMEMQGSWRAWVDGEEVKILPFAGAFVGLPLSEGEHTVRFAYSPLGYAKGLWISVGSLLLLAALWVWEKKGGKLFPDKPLPPPPAEDLEKPMKTEEGESNDPTKTDESDPQGT